MKGRVIVIGSESVPDMSKTNIYNESIKLTQEKYHCTFKFIKKEYVSLYQDLINGHAAGKSNYDVVNLRGYEIFPNAANSGTILDVSSYYDFAGDPTWQESSVKDLGVFKGKRYGIPYSPNEVGNGIWYNRALLRKFNVPDLWTYVEKDTWNWQTFRAVCKKLTQDTNGDGKPDYWGFTSSDPWLEFVYSNNGSLISSGVNGTPKISLEFQERPDASIYCRPAHDRQYGAGRQRAGRHHRQAFQCPVYRQGGHVSVSRPLRRGDGEHGHSGGGHRLGLHAQGAGGQELCHRERLYARYVCGAADISNPKEVVAAIQDVAAYWDTSRKVRVDMYGKTEELYQALKSSLDANAKKVLEYQAKHPVYTLANNYNLSETLQNELWPAILNGKSVKSAVDSVKSKMQTELTKKYNGTIVK